ncbi:hypothetical protein PVAND_014884 [Polypedilum vanderplanki]|uniref:C2H2-type domain-containing protein n=1 Tax=Polypedilum vanderplanki TaxID=319348 RepID=A0A9J6BAN3_POLVA|nr:hypothetical protein PVAND_014884 [Polypedilum vanderplanki]
MNKRNIKHEPKNLQNCTNIKTQSIKTEPTEALCIQSDNNLKISSVFCQFNEEIFTNQKIEEKLKPKQNAKKNQKRIFGKAKTQKPPKKIKLSKNKPETKRKTKLKQNEDNFNDCLDMAQNSEEIIKKYAKQLQNASKVKPEVQNVPATQKTFQNEEEKVIKSLPFENPIIVHSSLNFIQPNPDIFVSDQKPRKIKRNPDLHFDCFHCGKRFKSKYSIIWHMKVHMETMPYNCTICGKGFSYERSFKQHELSHAKKLTCEICQKQLKPHAMYYHMKFKHSNERTHQCPLCDKTFKTKDNITRHIMRHKPNFNCEFCGKKFPENSRLQIHLRFHTNPDEFHCKICNKTFEHIDKHVQRLHVKNRERVFKCSYCVYASDSKQTITRHEEMHVKRMEKKAGSKKVKINKLEIKTFQCQICKVYLQTKQGYKSHLRHYHQGVDIKKEKDDEVKEEAKQQEILTEIVEIKIEKEEISVIQ